MFVWGSIHSFITSLACGVHLDFISMVLLVNPDEEIPLEVQNVSKQLSSTQLSNREVSISLILHCFQAALGTKYNLQALHTALQVIGQSVNVYYLNSFILLTLPETSHTHIMLLLQAKQPEELEKLRDVVTDMMETAASTADLSTARQGLLHSMETLIKSLAAEAPLDNCPDTGMMRTPWTFQKPNDCNEVAVSCNNVCFPRLWSSKLPSTNYYRPFLGPVETFKLPFPTCHTCSWENDNFGN